MEKKLPPSRYDRFQKLLHNYKMGRLTNLQFFEETRDIFETKKRTGDAK